MSRAASVSSLLAGSLSPPFASRRSGGRPQQQQPSSSSPAPHTTSTQPVEGAEEEGELMEAWRTHAAARQKRIESAMLAARRQQRQEEEQEETGATSVPAASLSAAPSSSSLLPVAPVSPLSPSSSDSSFHTARLEAQLAQHRAFLDSLSQPPQSQQQSRTSSAATAAAAAATHASNSNSNTHSDRQTDVEESRALLQRAQSMLQQMRPQAAPQPVPGTRSLLRSPVQRPSYAAAHGEPNQDVAAAANHAMVPLGAAQPAVPPAHSSSPPRSFEAEHGDSPSRSQWQDVSSSPPPRHPPSQSRRSTLTPSPSSPPTNPTTPSRSPYLAADLTPTPRSSASFGYDEFALSDNVFMLSEKKSSRSGGGVRNSADALAMQLMAASLRGSDSQGSSKRSSMQRSVGASPQMMSRGASEEDLYRYGQSPSPAPSSSSMHRSPHASPSASASPGPVASPAAFQRPSYGSAPHSPDLPHDSSLNTSNLSQHFLPPSSPTGGLAQSNGVDGTNLLALAHLGMRSGPQEEARHSQGRHSQHRNGSQPSALRVQVETEEEKEQSRHATSSSQRWDHSSHGHLPPPRLSPHTATTPSPLPPHPSALLSSTDLHDSALSASFNRHHTQRVQEDQYRPKPIKQAQQGQTQKQRKEEQDGSVKDSAASSKKKKSGIPAHGAARPASASRSTAGATHKQHTSFPARRPSSSSHPRSATRSTQSAQRTSGQPLPEPQRTAPSHPASQPTLPYSEMYAASMREHEQEEEGDDGTSENQSVPIDADEWHELDDEELIDSSRAPSHSYSPPPASHSTSYSAYPFSPVEAPRLNPPRAHPPPQMAPSSQVRVRPASRAAPAPQPAPAPASHPASSIAALYSLTSQIKHEEAEEDEEALVESQLRRLDHALEVQKLREEIGRLRTESGLGQLFEQYEATIASLQQQNSALRNRLSKLECPPDLLKHVRGSSQAWEEEQGLITGHSTSSLSSSVAAPFKLHAQYRILENSYRRVSEELSQLEKSHASLSKRERHFLLQSKRVTHLQARVVEQSNLLTKKEKEIATLRTKVDGLTAANEELKGLVVDLSEKQAAEGAKAKKAQMEAEKMKGEVERLAAQLFNTKAAVITQQLKGPKGGVRRSTAASTSTSSAASSSQLHSDLSDLESLFLQKRQADTPPNLVHSSNRRGLETLCRLRTKVEALLKEHTQTQQNEKALLMLVMQLQEKRGV